MDDEHFAYKDDPRIPCQFGRKCYQKNPTHHKKYKHPPDPKRKKTFAKYGNELKKLKLNADIEAASRKEVVGESCIKENEKVQISNDVSDESEKEEEVPELEPDEILKKMSENKVTNKCMKCSHLNGHNNESSRKFIKEKFLLEFPEDFYQFYEFCEEKNKENPNKVLLDVGLELVGPFDVLRGKFCGVIKEDEQYLLHWRYFHDTPQMVTVLKGEDSTGYHIGYFWDLPNENPVFLVENHANKDGTFEIVGENIFAAVSSYLEDKLQKVDPFRKLKFVKLANEIKQEAEKLKLDLGRKTKNIIKRNNKILTRTFNKIGLIVPYVRKTQLGYRKLAMSDKDLETLLSKIKKAHPDQKPKLLAELQAEILTWTDIASDECDFGTGIELGLDIISHGVEDLNQTAKRLLVSNYKLLKWDAFAKIAEAHMNNRKKSVHLSVL